MGELEGMKQEVMDFLGDEVPEGFEEEPLDVVDEEFFGQDDDLEDSDTDDAEPVEDPVEGEPEPEPEGEPVVEDPPVQDDLGDDPEPEADPEPTPEPVSADPTIEALKAQNEALMAQFEELQQKITSMQTPTEEEPPTQTVAQVGEGGVMDFIGEEDLDEILSDKSKFNAFLSNVVNQVQTSTVENVYRNLPQMVQTQVSSQQKITTYVDEFYKANEDLLPVRKTVGAVANEVASEHPEMQLEQIFEETEKRVRTMLGLAKKAAQPPQKSSTQPAGNSPALPKQGARRAGATAKRLSGQAKHIQDVL